MKSNAQVLLPTGGPGAGKGTQTEALCKETGLPPMAGSALLKRERDKPGSKRGAKIKEIMEAGGLVPDEWINELAEAELALPPYDDGVIGDGYPRTKEQAAFLNQLVAKSGVELPTAIYLQNSLSTLVYRLSHRRICSSEACKRIYHLIDDPPPKVETCHCGAALYQRNDDTPKVIKNRLKEFLVAFKPMRDYWKANGQLITIRCGKRTKEEVTAAILRKLRARRS